MTWTSKDFPTATLEALIQQNKTLSAKISYFLRLCTSQEEQIRNLKQKCHQIQAQTSKESIEAKTLEESYQKLYASHQKFKKNLIEAEKQFALQYTDFLEKQNILKAEKSKLKSRVSLLERYKYRIYKKVKPYLRKLKNKILQNQKESLKKDEKLLFFQKQLKLAYSYIQKMSLEFQQKEKAFQVHINQLKAQIEQIETDHQQSKLCISENQQLKRQLLQIQKQASALQASLTHKEQEKTNLEKQNSTEIKKLRNQVQILTTQKAYLTDQLKILTDTLEKTFNKQSYGHTLWRKKLTSQLEYLQKTLQNKNTVNKETTKPINKQDIIKPATLNKRTSNQQQNFPKQINRTYQSVLKLQADI